MPGTDPRLVLGPAPFSTRQVWCCRGPQHYRTSLVPLHLAVLTWGMVLPGLTTRHDSGRAARHRRNEPRRRLRYLPTHLVQKARY
eukprot:3917221-Rhodomonas_salina.3